MSWESRLARPDGHFVYGFTEMLFTGGRVILADEVRDDLDVVVADGKIVELRQAKTARPTAAESGKDITELRGNYLAPGLIDLHVHGALGHDMMETTPEAFAAICDFHARGGTTSLLLTTTTAPIEEIVRALELVREQMKVEGDHRLASPVPSIIGAHLEGPFLSPEKAGAQDRAHMLLPTPVLVERLLEYRGVIRRVTLAPEISGALEAIERFAAGGINVSGGHSNAWDDEARAAFQRGMRSVTHTCNCMSSVRRRGRQRVAGLLEFALSEPQVSCELIADGHHVSPTLMKMLYRAKGPHGICLVTDATAGAGLPEKTRFHLAGQVCVVEDGVCLLADRSALAGSASSMIDLVRMMVREVGLRVEEAIAMASKNPAREIGLLRKGEIKSGNDADLVVLSPELEVEQTWIGGRRVGSGLPAASVRKVLKAPREIQRYGERHQGG